MQPEFKCDSCRYKIPFRPITKQLDGLEFGFVKCPECETVFPSYVRDKAIHHRIREIEELRQKRKKLVDQVQAGRIVFDKYLAEWDQTFDKERELIEQNKAEIKRLLSQHIDTFRQWGSL